MNLSITIKNNLLNIKEKYSPKKLLSDYKYKVCDNVLLYDNNDFPTYELYNAMQYIYGGNKLENFKMEDVENKNVCIYFRIIGENLFGGLYHTTKEDFLTYIAFISTIDDFDATDSGYIYTPQDDFFVKLKESLQEII